MAYSETKVIIGGLAHVPILIFIVNLIKGKFATKAEDLKVVGVKDEEQKIKVAELKREESKPEDDKKNEVKEEVFIAEEEKPEDLEEGKEVS